MTGVHKNWEIIDGGTPMYELKAFGKAYVFFGKPYNFWGKQHFPHFNHWVMVTGLWGTGPPYLPEFTWSCSNQLTEFKVEAFGCGYKLWLVCNGLFVVQFNVFINYLSFHHPNDRILWKLTSLRQCADCRFSKDRDEASWPHNFFNFSGRGVGRARPSLCMELPVGWEFIFIFLLSFFYTEFNFF